MNDEQQCPQCGATLPDGTPEALCPACLLRRGFETQTAGGAAAASNVPPPTPEALASRFPQLEIVELIGRGGMGVVYKARHRGLDRWVALKILPAAAERDPAFAERFAREARALAKLDHPNIVAVHDSGEADGLFYFIMEYVDGANLRQVLAAGGMKPEQALAIVPQICDALQYAHDQGVVHRDIKPENILVDKQGRVKIADFGLAKIVGREAQDFTLTGVGEVMGTPAYMAPEQVEHPSEVDHRADIYSLGVVFYQMLTGELPLGRFAPPSRKVHIDVRLDEVVLRALEKEPGLRYQQAEEVKTEVETIAGSPEPASHEPESFLEKAGWKNGLVTYSPLAREIRAHMNAPEKREMAMRGLMYWIWVYMTFLLPFFIGIWTWLRTPHGYVGCLIAVLIFLIGLAGLQVWRKIQLEFLVSAAWAREHGITRDQLRKSAEMFAIPTRERTGWSMAILAGMFSVLFAIDAVGLPPAIDRWVTLLPFLIFGYLLHYGLWERLRVKNTGEKSHWRLHVAAGLLMLVVLGVTLAVYHQQHKKPSPASQPATSQVVSQALDTISQCAEGDPRVATALKTLRGLDPAQVVSALVPLLDSPVPTLRRSAIYVLYVGGLKPIDPAVAPLQKLLGHSEEFTRGMAAVALGTNRVASSFDALVSMAKNDSSAYARRCAVAALGLLGDERAIPVLKAAQSDADPSVRKNATDALARLQGGKPEPSATPRAKEAAPNNSAALLQQSAVAFTDLLAKGDFAKARAEFDATMTAAMSEQALATVWAQLAAGGGKYLGHDAPRQETFGEFIIVYVPCRWERTRLDLKVVYNKAGKVSGLWIVSPGSSLYGGAPSATQKAVDAPAELSPVERFQAALQQDADRRDKDALLSRFNLEGTDAKVKEEATRLVDRILAWPGVKVECRQRAVTEQPLGESEWDGKKYTLNGKPTLHVSFHNTDPLLNKSNGPIFSGGQTAHGMRVLLWVQTSQPAARLEPAVADVGKGLFAIHGVAETAGPTTTDYPLANRQSEPETVHLEPAVLLDYLALKSVKVEHDANGYSLLLTLDEEGTRRFAEITARRLGKRIGIVVDGKLRSAPVVRDIIFGGSFTVGGDFTEQEANRLAAKLNQAIRSE
jgi:predicted Ser/Thr protein kinase